MKLIEKILFSTRSMAAMLLIYAISMAVATFVENDFGTPAAKEMIYNARWFDVLQLLLIINFVVNIKRYRLWQKEKWSLLLFHLAFPVILLGAAITHFFAVEGMMFIREGETSNQIVSAQTYMRLNIFDQNRQLAYDTPYQMTYFNRADAPSLFRRTFEHKYQFKDKIIQLKTLDYIPLAKDTLIPSAQGKETLELVTIGANGRNTDYIQAGELKQISGVMFSYNKPTPGTIQLFSKGDSLWINSALEGEYMQMQGQGVGQVTDSTLLAQNSGKIEVNKIQPLLLKSLYSIGNDEIGIAQFVIPRTPFQAIQKFTPGDKNNPKEKANEDILLVEFSTPNAKDTLVVRGGVGSTNYSVRKEIDGLQVSLGFGSKYITTPFGIKLRDFQMERYPGSNNPSSYASEITVIDEGKEQDYRIFMNNVLDHGGYRFFQSSYDPDELGTRLSVNQDRPGTIITYIGYGMLFLGMFLTLFWRGTRFWKLQEMLKNIAKKTALVAFLLPFALMGQHAEDSHASDAPHQHMGLTPEHFEMVSGDSIAQQVTFDPAHIHNFEQLQVQDNQGRMKPMGTHALELLRKIYKKDNFHGLNATEWFISLQQKPALWANAPLIRVTDKVGPKALETLGVNEDGRTSLMNLVDPKTTQFKLQKEYNEAFRKKAAERSSYDNEIINVTERFTIMDNVAKGYHLRMIPIQNDINETWTSWIVPKENEIDIDSTALKFWGNYLGAVFNAQKTGDWTKANEELEKIDAYQKKWGKNVVLSPTKVKIELWYNKISPFFYLMMGYTIVGAILLIFAFASLFSEEKWITIPLKISLASLAILFVMHAAALIIRWYISGHAPWTSGYEAVIFISWIGVLAGWLLYRNGNAFLPAAGCFVAVIMMGFAHGSSLLDPQITPLVPVLKSYWLLIHVAIITSSYGFFGLGMVISIFTLILFLFKPNAKITRSVKELVIVNEMSLTIGLFALTIGTFLGGMWANESWGRYWSWDPKETWAFISVIVYAFVLHMRLVPGLRGSFAFSLASLWAASAPIMTYFGVNYYLSGLHTYAAGDSIPIPAWVPISVATFLVLSIVSYIFYRKFHHKKI